VQSPPMTDMHSAYYVRFGRSPDCDWVVQIPTVSALHCQVYWAPQAGSYVLEDLQSTHGTWLNGQRLPPQRSASVRIGDEIGLGAKWCFRLGPHHVQKLTRPGQAWTSAALPELERMAGNQAKSAPERTTARQSNVRLDRAEAWGIAAPHRARASEVVDIWHAGSQDSEPREPASNTVQSLESRAQSEMPLVLISPEFVRFTTFATLGILAPLWTALAFHSAKRLQRRDMTFGDGFIAGLIWPFWPPYVRMMLPSQLAEKYPVQAARLNFDPYYLARVACVPVVGSAIWLSAVTSLLQAVWTEERIPLPDTGSHLGSADRT
jgi:hypothetical protein